MLQSDRKVEAFLHPLFQNAFTVDAVLDQFQFWDSVSVSRGWVLCCDYEAILRDRNIQLSAGVNRKFKK